MKKGITNESSVLRELALPNLARTYDFYVDKFRAIKKLYSSIENRVINEVDIVKFSPDSNISEYMFQRYWLRPQAKSDGKKDSNYKKPKKRVNKFLVALSPDHTQYRVLT